MNREMESLKQERDIWLLAGRKLSVTVDIGGIEKFHREVQDLVAYLPHFGSANGMLIGINDSSNFFERELLALARSNEMFVSFVAPGLPESESEYDESDIVEALMDWGYFGPADQRPEWFPGDTPFGWMSELARRYGLDEGM